MRGQAPFGSRSPSPATSSTRRRRRRVRVDPARSTRSTRCSDSRVGWNNVVPAAALRLVPPPHRRYDDLPPRCRSAPSTTSRSPRRSTSSCWAPPPRVSAADARRTPAFPASTRSSCAPRAASALARRHACSRIANVATVCEPRRAPDRTANHAARRRVLRGRRAQRDAPGAARPRVRVGAAEDASAEAPLGWNGVVRAGAQADNRSSSARQTAIISVPQFARYSIGSSPRRSASSSPPPRCSAAASRSSRRRRSSSRRRRRRSSAAPSSRTSTRPSCARPPTTR